MHPCNNQQNEYIKINFWTLKPIPLMYMSIFIPLSHDYINYHSFAVSFEIRNCKYSNFVIFSPR